MPHSSTNPRPGSSTDSSLLRRVQGHETAAWNRLVEWAGPLILHWCRRAGLSAEDCEEVFQEVFLSVASNIGRFQGGRPGDTFRGWLLTITHSRIVDLGRRRMNQPQAEGGSDGYRRLLALTCEQLSASEPGPADTRNLLLRRALDLIRAEFSERIWQAFWRTAVDGLTAPDVAGELRMTPQAVRKARSRVLARLREEFRELLD
jgi:RNA polymerase sigma-70 factor (ECF subfamily)